MTAMVELFRVDHAALVEWLSTTYGLGQRAKTQFENPHRVRRGTMAERLHLYQDKARIPISRLIDELYDTETSRNDLKRFLNAAKYQNVSSRIVNEVANLYDRPAIRTLKDRNEEFQLEQKRIKLPAVIKQAHRLTNLLNETLLWQFSGVDGAKTLRIITPDRFDVVGDPRDSLVPAGFIIDCPRVSAMPAEIANKLPCVEIWDDTFRYLLNAEGHLVDDNGVGVGAPQEHGLKRIPGVLLHRQEPLDEILDGNTGDDVKAAHLAVSLINVLTLRLSKSQGENQPVLSGNLANLAANQALHPEKPIALPPGVTLEMLQMRTDPAHYLSAKRDVIASVGARYGLSYEQLTLELGADAASGKSYQVRREKLTELRMEQRERALMHERMVIELMGFNPEGMRIDFQEQALPLDAQEEVDLLDSKMRKGLDSPVDYIMRHDPDLSRQDAQARMAANLADWAALIMMVRALNLPASGDAANPGSSPQQNGANNQSQQPQQATAPSDQQSEKTTRQTEQPAA